jgi:hypothetical protein
MKCGASVSAAGQPDVLTGGAFGRGAGPGPGGWSEQYIAFLGMALFANLHAQRHSFIPFLDNPGPRSLMFTSAILCLQSLVAPLLILQETYQRTWILPETLRR